MSSLVYLGTGMCIPNLQSRKLTWKNAVSGHYHDFWNSKHKTGILRHCKLHSLEKQQQPGVILHIWVLTVISMGCSGFTWFADLPGQQPFSFTIGSLQEIRSISNQSPLKTSQEKEFQSFMSAALSQMMFSEEWETPGIRTSRNSTSK